MFREFGVESLSDILKTVGLRLNPLKTYEKLKPTLDDTVTYEGSGFLRYDREPDVADLVREKLQREEMPDGYVYDPDGVCTQEKFDFMLSMRAGGADKVEPYADRFGVEFFPGEKPWGVKADVVMPSAMQNDVHMEQAKQIAANGVKYYIEVANMPTTNDALRFLMEQPGMIVAPSKAVNAGGVATSALEMAQNSERLVWTAEEVDAQLHRIMNTIYQMSVDAAAEYGLGYNLVAGANIAGFKRVAEAMMEQGVF